MYQQKSINKYISISKSNYRAKESRSFQVFLFLPLVDYWIIMLEVFFFLVEKRMQLVCTAFSTESRRPETGGSEKGTTETMVFEAAAAANAAAVLVHRPSAVCRSSSFPREFFAEPSETRAEAPFWRLLPQCYH